MPSQRIAMQDHVDTLGAVNPHANHLITALSQADYKKLEPHLAAVSLDAGATIITGAGSEHVLYFPVDCVISLLHEDDGGLNEIALIGNDGVVGVSLVLLGETTLSRSIVITPGTVYQLDTKALALNFSPDSPLQQQLFDYAQVLVTQMGQNAYCRQRHSAEQQLCRWLLCCQDRMPDAQLRIKPTLLAEILGVAVDDLQKTAAGLRSHGLEFDDGYFSVSARHALHERCCECPAAIKAKTRLWQDS
jgi:CRP-like cAMP-binding protein